MGASAVSLQQGRAGLQGLHPTDKVNSRYPVVLRTNPSGLWRRIDAGPNTDHKPVTQAADILAIWDFHQSCVR
ncbi:hypothetical protein GCM10009722_15590 [Williamsia deligens]